MASFELASLGFETVKTTARELASSLQVMSSTLIPHLFFAAVKSVDGVVNRVVTTLVSTVMV